MSDNYLDDSVYRIFEAKLREIARIWRVKKDPRVVEIYQAVLKTLLLLGWNDRLDSESELPPHYLPESYLNHSGLSLRELLKGEPSPQIKGSFSDEPAYDAIGWLPGETVTRWRRTKEAELVQIYREALLTLQIIGWKDALDVDIELPRDLMPTEYPTIPK